MRLDRLLSGQGMTRRQAREVLSAGRVQLDGQVARDGALHVPEGARVTLDQSPVGPRGHIHLMLHKPAGVITAKQDSSLPTVMQLIDPAYLRNDLSPVGRLDRDVTGLLLMTTDGQLDHRLISPKWSVEKIYLARVEGELTGADVRRMAEGVALKDFTCKGARLRILQSGQTSLSELTVTEGKYHQVKRMFQALDHPVLTLHRRSVGGVELDERLRPGEARPLTDAEKARLYELVRLEEA